MNFLELLPFMLLAYSGVLCHDQQESFPTEALPEFNNAEDQTVANGAAPNSGGKRMLVEEATLQREPEVTTTPEVGKPATFPFSDKKLEKMMEKAILKIITGDLSNADLHLLKSLNYSLEEVMAIRKREMGGTKDDFGGPKMEKSFEDKQQELKNFDLARYQMEVDYENQKQKNELASEEQTRERKTFDYDSYNNQAVYDYENASSEREFKESQEESLLTEYKDLVPPMSESEENVQQTFDRLMEPHVIFKIRYDDSDLDSESVEKLKLDQGKGNRSSPGSTESTFREASTPVHHPYPLVYQLGGFDEHRNHLVATTEEHQEVDEVPDKNLTEVPSVDLEEHLWYQPSTTTEPPTSTLEESVSLTTSHQVNLSPTPVSVDPKINRTAVQPHPKGVIYQGLEWVADDVYRVLPEVLELEAADYLEGMTDSSQDDVMETSEISVQNDPPVQLVTANENASTAPGTTVNLTTYQQLSQALRKDGNLTTSLPDRQGQKAIEEIKMRVLALTRRFNSTSNDNHVQREKLTMFSPKCDLPRNTDPESWADQYSMNMYFQQNLTSREHVVAAKLRLFKLPQQNVTSLNGANFEEEEEDERKIRISVYFYTKTLKKHRSKKRLMDSVVTPLTSTGALMALDVRQSLRFWRSNSRNGNVNGNNHGLVVMVEDQDGKPLKPSLYLQPPSCQTTVQHQDDKAYQRVPALFIRACARYIRIIGSEEVTYVDCRQQNQQ